MKHTRERNITLASVSLPPCEFCPPAIVALLSSPRPARRAADPIDHSQPPAPDGTPICASWVHDRYTVERDGRFYATWHPPKDPRYGCAFGHEHGSNPRAFRFSAAPACRRSAS